MNATKVIIYDDSCPMCKLYTWWFVLTGMLKPENRIGFATASEEILSSIDLIRCRHEIPLYDRATGETIYGLKALTFVVGSKFPLLRPVLDSQVLYWMLYPLYQIITYNRRVIAGCKAACGFDCAPDFHRFYRSLYLGLAMAFVGGVGGLLMIGSHWIAVAVLMSFVVMTACVGTIRVVSGAEGSGWDWFGNAVTVLIVVAGTCLPSVFLGEGGDLGGLASVFSLLLGLEEVIRRRLLY